MKSIILSLVIFTTATVNAQDHTLEKIWETDSVIAVPESVLPAKKNLFVSLIDGNPWDVDGKGGVAKLGTDGSILNAAWITGLNAPKGMGIKGNRLYVADVSQVIIIDIKNGRITGNIAIEGATGLNDITINDKGIMYVSDSKTAKIWRIEKDVPALYLDNVKGVNGLRAVGDDLYIGAGKLFMKADANKQLTQVAEVTQGIDGIEPVGNGDFLLTAWGGYIWYAHAGGRVETLLETHPQKKNTADIGYDPKKRIVYVPSFFAKTVAAYRLK